MKYVEEKDFKIRPTSQQTQYPSKMLLKRLHSETDPCDYLRRIKRNESIKEDTE
jgi:hypothetical protein